MPSPNDPVHPATAAPPAAIEILKSTLRTCEYVEKGEAERQDS